MMQRTAQQVRSTYVDDDYLWNIRHSCTTALLHWLRTILKENDVTFHGWKQMLSLSFVTDAGQTIQVLALQRYTLKLHHHHHHLSLSLRCNSWVKFIEVTLLSLYKCRILLLSSRSLCVWTLMMRHVSLYVCAPVNVILFLLLGASLLMQRLTRTERTCALSKYKQNMYNKKSEREFNTSGPRLHTCVCVSVSKWFLPA